MKKHPPLIVNLLTNVSNEKLDFIIDTGSNLSFIKLECIEFLRDQVDLNDRRKLSGIGKDVVETFGQLSVNIYIDNICAKFNFQVLAENSTNLNYSGILGRDFQSASNMIINWDQDKILIKLKDRVLDFVINKSIGKFSVEKSCQSVHLVKTSFLGQAVVNKQEIADGVFIPNCYQDMSEIRKEVHDLIHMQIVITQWTIVTD